MFYLDIGFLNEHNPSLGPVTMKNVIVVAVLAVALTGACLSFLLSDNQALHFDSPALPTSSALQFIVWAQGAIAGP